MNRNLTAWGIAVAACIPLFAAAQATSTEVPMSVAKLGYQSAFADYKPYKDTPLANWRALNDAVAGAPGGAAPAAPAPAATGAMPMKATASMPLHGGQHPHGGKP